MLKKFVRFVRAMIIGFLWSYLFIVVANAAMYALWNFNILSPRSWQTISSFWQGGGVIKSNKDYLFLSMLFSLPVFWLWGWRRLCTLSYINILLSPINLYNQQVIKRYGLDSSRVVLRNLKSSQRIIEEIKGKLESIKPKKAKEVQNIRNKINKTISEEINNDK